MFAVATATTGLALVTEIDLGYFDKLLVAPIRRSSLILGRLTADLVRGVAASAIVLLVGIVVFGAHVHTGPAGAVVIVLLAALFGVAYAGFGILVALRTRNVQATNTSFLLFFPLLFLTPNFVPFDRLSPLMETLARINPVSYVIVGVRSLIIDGWVLDKILACVAVILVMRVALSASRCARSPPTTASRSQSLRSRGMPASRSASADHIKDVNWRYHDAAADSYDSKWGIDFGPIGQEQVESKIVKALGEVPIRSRSARRSRSAPAPATSRSTCFRPG